MERALENVGLALLILTVGLAVISCDSDRRNNSTPRSEPSSYVLPSELFLSPTAHRGPEGELYINGSTNLPDGVKFDIEVMPVSKEHFPSARLTSEATLARLGTVTVL